MLKIADSILNVQDQVEVFVEILHAVVHFFEKDVKDVGHDSCRELWRTAVMSPIHKFYDVQVTADFISNIVELTEGHLAEMEDSSQRRDAKQQFDSVMSRIRKKTSAGSKQQKADQISEDKPVTSYANFDWWVLFGTSDFRFRFFFPYLPQYIGVLIFAAVESIKLALKS